MTRTLFDDSWLPRRLLTFRRAGGDDPHRRILEHHAGFRRHTKPNGCRYNLLRPVTYIQAFIDADWLPILVTPPFPEYTSGHSVQSGAAAQVLTDLFGRRFAFVDRTHEDRGLPARSFVSFFQAAREAAISRLYGGIHYRPAIVRGLEQGRCVGQAVSSLEFRRRRPHHRKD